MSDDDETYTRTICIPVQTLTAKKAGMLNRAMKDYRRARALACSYFADNDVFDFGYGEREELRKSISNHDRVSLPSRAIYPAITTVEQNYKEYEKAADADPPQANRADTLALEGQNAYLFYDAGYYLNVATGHGAINLPLRVADDPYHRDYLPLPDAVPPAGRSRIGVKFSDIEPADFPGDVVKLSTSTLNKTGPRQFTANLVFKREKRIVRNTETPRHIVGLDRGRNELGYACLYDVEQDHVVDWLQVGGDEPEHYMDRFAERISEFQEANVWEQMEGARTRRYRYKRQLDYELANAVVDLARGHLSVAIAMEDLEGLSRMGNWPVESRRFNEWSYYRQQQYIEDKAEPYDIPVLTVDPEYTSQHCSRCGSEDTDRHSVHFECFDCGYQQHADANAAVNVAKRAAK